MDNQETINKLVTEYVDNLQALELYQDLVRKAEFNISKFMDKIDATVISTDDVQIERKLLSPKADMSILKPLLESAIADELIDKGAFIPQHQKTTTVEDSFNLTKLKPFMKRGGDIKSIIESGIVYGRVKLEIRRG